MAEIISTIGGVEYVVGDLAAVSGLTWSTSWPGGCLEASWTMDLPPNTYPPALAANAMVEIWDGPVRVWSGYVSESVPGETWEIHAKGWGSVFASLLALSSTPAPTAIPSIAVAQAITRSGAPVTVGSTLQATTITATNETAKAQYVSTLMDAYAEQVAKRWWVDENRTLWLTSDPIDYTWVLDSPDVLRGTADDDYVTNVYPRYATAVDVEGNPTTFALGGVGVTTQPAGRRERAMDVTDLGVLTAPAANALAQAQLDLNSARLGYTSGLEVGFGDLLTPGFTPARLGHVKAGQMFRAFNVADASGQVQVGMVADVVIGRTTYTDGATTVRIDPLGMATRTFVDTMQKALESDDTFDGKAA